MLSIYAHQGHARRFRCRAGGEMDSQYQGMAALGLEHRVVRAVVCYVFLRVKNRNRSVGNRKQCLVSFMSKHGSSFQVVKRIQRILTCRYPSRRWLQSRIVQIALDVFVPANAGTRPASTRPGARIARGLVALAGPGEHLAARFMIYYAASILVEWILVVLSATSSTRRLRYAWRCT